MAIGGVRRAGKPVGNGGEDLVVEISIGSRQEDLEVLGVDRAAIVEDKLAVENISGEQLRQIHDGGLQGDLSGWHIRLEDRGEDDLVPILDSDGDDLPFDSDQAVGERDLLAWRWLRDEPRRGRCCYYGSRPSRGSRKGHWEGQRTRHRRRRQ